ncbi:MAG: ABC transporter, partial [Acidobacteria bacterium]|nr:ABC transporter [Acidobacteriota bacterium]
MPEADRTWKGARWWKVDFHTHTPASLDYGKGPGQAAHQARQPRDWLLDFMAAGVDCVAVTDHNSGAWIDLLKNELTGLEATRPQGYRPLFLFPGVEISGNGGVHVLAVFDPTASTADIDSLLGAVAFDGTKGESDGVTRRSLVQVLEEIGNAGGIAIPAHVDGPRGLFRELRGTSLEQVLTHDSVFAMEVLNPKSEKPELYRSLKTSWTEVVGSDSHHPTSQGGPRFPGSHFTWVKMGQPSLEGLRLALLDGPLSILRSDQVTSDPNAHAALVLESLEVEAARYM